MPGKTEILSKKRYGKEGIGIKRETSLKLGFLKQR